MAASVLTSSSGVGAVPVLVTGSVFPAVVPSGTRVVGAVDTVSAVSPRLAVVAPAVVAGAIVVTFSVASTSAADVASGYTVVAATVVTLLVTLVTPSVVSDASDDVVVVATSSG